MPLRPLNASDLEAVNQLHRSVWWPERSTAGWRWLMTNPAAAEIDAPHGWVIDHGAGAEAVVGNFIQRFWLNGRALHGATGYSIVVPPAHRGRSRALIDAFLDQPACFARYTLNANARSSPLYKRHGMIPWPPDAHTVKLSWMIDPAACLCGRALRGVVDHAPAMADLLGEQLSPLPRLLKGRGLRLAERRLPPTVSLNPDLSARSDYARFWQALLSEGRLIADRSPSIMRWRLSDPDLTVPPLSLAYRQGGRITGFALAIPRWTPPRRRSQNTANSRRRRFEEGNSCVALLGRVTVSSQYVSHLLCLLPVLRKSTLVGGTFLSQRLTHISTSPTFLSCHQIRLKHFVAIL